MTNLEIVQTFYRAAATRDMATATGLLHPDIVFGQTPALPWGGEYRGLAGVQEFFGKLYGSIQSTVEMTEFIDAAESVVAIGWTRGTVNGSGAPFDIRIAHVLTLEGGKIVSFRPYINTPGMLAALAG